MEVSRPCLFFLIIFVLFLALRSEGRSYSFSKPAVSANGTALSVAGGGKHAVTVHVYYESLCPYCCNFIVNYLSKLFTDGLIDVVDLHLVPSGNARIGANDTIECQHGPYECFLNTVEACAINIWPDVHIHFRIIHCLEALTLERRAAEWETCFTKNTTQLRQIGECYNSGRGKELELKYVAEFDILKARHKYVPWVDYANVEQYICSSYTAGVLPKACKSLELKSLGSRNDQYNNVCHVDHE